MCSRQRDQTSEWLVLRLTSLLLVKLLLRQVDQLDSAARSGGAFNQPQYLHLKESLSSIIQHLNNLQVWTGVN